MNPAGMLLMDKASGTSVNPASSPMHMASAQSGTWTFVFHGILYLSEIQQSGPRGAGKFISTNWFMGDRKSTRLNSSHLVISYAVFCLKKKKKDVRQYTLAITFYVTL